MNADGSTELPHSLRHRRFARKPSRSYRKLKRNQYANHGSRISCAIWITVSLPSLRAAVARQATRGGVRGKLVPEFEGGGYVPGIDRGFDSVPILARPGELVLNKQQQRAIQGRAGANVFADAGVGSGGAGLQRFQSGGYVRAEAVGGAIVIELHVDEGVVLGQVASGKGERVIVRTVQKAKRNGEL